jgi:hypothetical protein
MATAVPAPDPEARYKRPSAGSGGGAGSQTTGRGRWLGPILQGVTILALLGIAYNFGNQLGRIEERLSRLDKIDSTLSDPNTGVVVRLARIEERLRLSTPPTPEQRR